MLDKLPNYMNPPIFFWKGSRIKNIGAKQLNSLRREPQIASIGN